MTGSFPTYLYRFQSPPSNPMGSLSFIRRNAPLVFGILLAMVGVDAYQSRLGMPFLGDWRSQVLISLVIIAANEATQWAKRLAGHSLVAADELPSEWANFLFALILAAWPASCYDHCVLRA